MSTTAPPDLDPVQALLIEFGQMRERIERYEQAERDRAAAVDTADQERARVLAEVNRDVCTLKWVMQPQGRILIANRVYTGRGPQKDRSSGRVTRQGDKFTAPADHARVLEESGYAEILEGREHVISWTPQWNPSNRAGPASAEPPTTNDGWEARQVFYD